MVRKWIGWFLISLIILQSGGYLISVHLMHLGSKIRARQIVMAGIPTKGLYKLTEHQITDAQWTEDDEFEWNGEMYDVVKTETGEKGRIYYCYHDVGETAIKQLLAYFTSHNENADQDLLTFSSLQLLSFNYTIDNARIALSTSTSGKLLYSPYHHHYINFRFGPPPPPPKALS